MRKKIIMAVLMAALAVPAALMADFKIGAAAGNQGIENFYLEIGNYSRVPQKEVIITRHQGIPDEDLPVLFFIAGKAGVHHRDIIVLRQKKWSWWKIAMKYRLDPAIFYVHVNTVIKSGPYGRAYGYYADKSRNKWKHRGLSDAEVVNFVNLRFMAEHYGHDPVQVIKMREQGRNFVVINNEIRNIHIKKVKSVQVRYKKSYDKYDKKHSTQKHEKDGSESYRDLDDRSTYQNEKKNGHGH